MSVNQQQSKYLSSPVDHVSSDIKGNDRRQHHRRT